MAEGATLAALARGPSVYAPRRHPERAVARRNLVLAVMAREHYLSDIARGARPGRAAPALARRVAAARGPLVRARPGARRGRLGARRRPAGRPHRLHHARRPGAARRRGARCGARRTRSTAWRAPRAAATRCRARWWRSIRGTARSAPWWAAGATCPAASTARSSARRQPGSAFKPFVYAAALAAGLTPAAVVDGYAGRDHRARTGVAPGQLRRPLRRPPHAPARAHALGQRRHRAAGRGRGRAAGRGAGPPRRHPEPARRGAGARARRRRGDAARAGRRVRAVRQRRRSGSRRRSCAASRRATARVLWRAPAAQGRARARRGARRSSSRRCWSRWWTAAPAGWCATAACAASVAGKTGTTNDGTDVWFVGYTPTVVAAVWFGYDAPRPIAPAASGGRLAAPAWAAFYLDGWRERDARRLDAARRHGEPHDRRLQRRPRQRVVPRDPARVVSRRHRAHAHLHRAQGAVRSSGWRSSGGRWGRR